jgi:hypothetical protein
MPSQRTARGRFTTLLVVAVMAVPAAAGPKPSTVPPTLELEILDPNADPVGNPAVETVPGLPGQLKIDIPPTVIVHKYYYTGDRTFQAPFLKGGPCTLVVNHPRTAERLYIPVQMFPGAPKITYRHHCIDYDFGAQNISISFGWLVDRPKVTYCTSPPLLGRVEARLEKVKKAGKDLVVRTGLPQAGRMVVEGTKKVTVTAVDRASDAGKFLLRPPLQAAQFIPGANLLQSTPEDQAARLREAQLQRAEFDAAKQRVTLPTNR